MVSATSTSTNSTALSRFSRGAQPANAIAADLAFLCLFALAIVERFRAPRSR
jgi:hypothetical protein